MINLMVNKCLFSSHMVYKNILNRNGANVSITTCARI